jgi:hypothetical protein
MVFIYLLIYLPKCNVKFLPKHVTCLPKYVNQLIVIILLLLFEIHAERERFDVGELHDMFYISILMYFN